MMNKTIAIVNQLENSIDVRIEQFPITYYPEYMLKQVIDNLEDILLIKDPNLTVLYDGFCKSILNHVALVLDGFVTADYVVFVDGDDIVAVDISDELSLAEVLLIDKVANKRLIDTVKESCKMIVDIDKL